MLPKELLSLLTCCALVLGTSLPPGILSSSSSPVLERLALLLQRDRVAVDQAVSTTTTGTIVPTHHPDMPQAETDTIEYGQTVYGSIDVVGEEDHFTFTGEAGDQLYAWLDSPVDKEFQLTLTGPGVSTRTCYSWDSCTIDDVTLSTAGLHTLTVTGSGAYTGSYSLYLGLVNAPPETITYGETVTGTISIPGERDHYNFDGEPGDLISAQLKSPIGAEFYLNLTMPDGGFRSCFSYDYCLIEDVTLPSSGVYTLTVGGSGSYTGDYYLTLGSSEPQAMAIGESRSIVVTPALPVRVQIDVPSRTDDVYALLQKYAMSYSELELYRGDRLLKSSDAWTDQILRLPSPDPGTYDLEVSGSVEGRLSVLESLPDLPLGQWVAGTIYSEYGLAWYQCDVPAGQDTLYVYAEALGILSELDVYQGSIGGTPHWSAYGSDMTLEIPDPDPGRYYVQLSDSAFVVGDSQTRDHMIRADTVPIEPPACSQPIVSSFTPLTGGTEAPVTVSISGQCLDQTDSVCLTRSGYSEVCADSVSRSDDGHSLSAVFDLSEAQPGDWSLELITAGSQSITAPTAFSVDDGGEPNLWVEIVGREQFRIGRTQTYHVKYGNSGSVDAYDVLLHVRVPAAYEVSVDLPHPPGVSIDWESIPSAVEVGAEKVIPLWLFRIGAESQDGFDMSIRIPGGQIGDQLTITAELAQVSSRFAQTGDLDDIKDSPVFLMLVESMLETLGVAGERGTAPDASTLRAGTSTDSFGDTVDGLFQSVKTWWDYQAPKGAIVGAGLGLLAMALGGPLTWLVVGISLGSAVDAVWSGFSLHKLVTIPVFRRLAEIFGADLIDSISPEDKFGPSGYDPPDTATADLERWIPADRAMDYRIDFWNKEDAPAATVDVIITDTLDANLDWDTFNFGEFGFLDWRVELEPTQYFNVDVENVSVDLSQYYPGEPVVDLVVNVEGTYDASSGFVEWRFKTLDPTTRQPPENPYAGFLPPITDSGWEVGWVEFSVTQKPGLPSGTTIQNQAFVKFDLNKYNPAPKERPFINTVDSTPPTSAAQIPGAPPQCSGIGLTWSGQDDQNGSGLHSVDLYVDDLTDEDPPYLWRGTVQERSATFMGTPGRTYGFYTRARDNAGNLESAPDPLVYDAQADVMARCLFLPVTAVNH